MEFDTKSIEPLHCWGLLKIWSTLCKNKGGLVLTCLILNFQVWHSSHYRSFEIHLPVQKTKWYNFSKRNKRSKEAFFEQGKQKLQELFGSLLALLQKAFLQFVVPRRRQPERAHAGSDAYFYGKPQKASLMFTVGSKIRVDQTAADKLP